MTAVKQNDLISVEDYLSRERKAAQRHEYTGGYIYMMASGRNVHNKIAGTFYGIMFTKLRGKRCRPFNTDTKVRVRMPTHTRFYYPDGLVVCEQNPEDDEFQDRPVVIAEVLSPGSHRIDESEKREAYLTMASLDAYLVVDADRARVVVYRRTISGFVSEVYEGLDAIVPLPTLEVELALAELYEQVDFAVAVREANEEREELGFPSENES